MNAKQIGRYLCLYILNRLVDSWQLAISELYFTHIRLNPEWAGSLMNMLKEMKNIILAQSQTLKEFKTKESQYVGCVEVICTLPVKDYPELAIASWRDLDEPWYGCPHHLSLSEDKRKVQYVRHGTNISGETGSFYIEEEYDTFKCYAPFEKEDIEKLPDGELKTQCKKQYELCKQGSYGRYYK